MNKAFRKCNDQLHYIYLLDDIHEMFISFENVVSLLQLCDEKNKQTVDLKLCHVINETHVNNYVGAPRNYHAVSTCFSSLLLCYSFKSFCKKIC